MYISKSWFKTYIYIYSLFTCPKTNIGTLKKKRITHPLFITALIIVQPKEYLALPN